MGTWEDIRTMYRHRDPIEEWRFWRDLYVPEEPIVVNNGKGASVVLTVERMIDLVNARWELYGGLR